MMKAMQMNRGENKKEKKGEIRKANGKIKKKNKRRKKDKPDYKRESKTNKLIVISFVSCSLARPRY